MTKEKVPKDLKFYLVNIEPLHNSRFTIVRITEEWWENVNWQFVKSRYRLAFKTRKEAKKFCDEFIKLYNSFER